MIDWKKWFGRRRVVLPLSGTAQAPVQGDVAAPRPPAAGNTRLLLVIALQAALIIGLTWALVYFARDEYNAVVKREEDEIATPSRVSSKDGAALVKLTAQEQRANGIETRPLQAQNSSARVQAYGSVVDLAALFETRMKYLAALDEARVVRAQLARSEAEYRRASTLFKDDRGVSERVVQEAQAALRADQAKLAASNRLAAEFVAQMRQQWGDTLAQGAPQANAELIAKLADGQEAILRIALPAQEAPAQLQIAPLSGGEGEWVSARLVGPAPHSDAQFAGTTFFYRAPARALRIGMQLTARHDVGQRVAGVVVPREAVLWHGGKSWVYVKQGADAYIRREVTAGEALDAGWFVPSGFAAGQEVVVSGAQLLLSEEFRYQVRNENDD